MLGVELPWLDNVERARPPVRLPVALSRAEVRALLAHLDEPCGYDIRTVQELLGHRVVSTTMIDTHALNRGGRGMRSPLEGLGRADHAGSRGSSI